MKIASLVVAGTLQQNLGTTDVPQFAGLVVPYVAPSSDSTTAFQIMMSDRSTAVVTVDTTNRKVQISSADTVAYYPLVLSSGVIGTDTNTVGMRLGYTGSTYQKAAIIFEGKDANARGHFHFALNSAASSANAALADSKMTIQYNGNVGLNQTTFGTNAAKVLAIGNGTAPTTSPADAVQVWSADNNGTAGHATLLMRNEIYAGTQTVDGTVYKTDTGDPANPYEGMKCINTFDNTYKVYADGAWRTIIATW